MGWFFVIVMGIIIGLLGKFFAPGDRDNIPIWLTVVCGIVGVVIGTAGSAAPRASTGRRSSSPSSSPRCS